VVVVVVVVTFVFVFYTCVDLAITSLFSHFKYIDDDDDDTSPCIHGYFRGIKWVTGEAFSYHTVQWKYGHKY